jgi:hypothetical protein
MGILTTEDTEGNHKEMRFKPSFSRETLKLIRSDNVAALTQFISEAFFIDRFQQSRAKILLNANGRRDERLVISLLRNSVSSVSSVVNIRLCGLAKRRPRPFKDALENKESVSAAQQGVASALWMGHEAEDIAVLIADSRNVVSRAVWVRGVRRASAGVAVTKQDAAFEFEAMKCGVICEIATLAMSDGKVENGPCPCGIREWTVVALDADVNVFANKVQSTISDECAREQARFAKDLKAIANTDDDSAAGGKAPHRAHDR